MKYKIKSLGGLALILMCFFFVSCDIKLPDEWQAPSWELPLTMPLINTKYKVAAISTPDNMIKIPYEEYFVDSNGNGIWEVDEEFIDENGDGICTPSDDFLLSTNENVIDSGSIKIEDDLFYIDVGEIAIPPISIPQISSSSLGGDFSPEIPPVPFPNVGGYDCIPKSSVFEEIGASVVLPISDQSSSSIEIFTDNDFATIAGVNSVHYLTIGSGVFGVNIDNNFPYPIDNFSIVLYDTVADTVWSSTSFLNVSGNEILSNNLIDKKLPGSLTLVSSYNISGESLNPNLNDCYQLYSDSDVFKYKLSFINECSNDPFLDAVIPCSCFTDPLGDTVCSDYDLSIPGSLFSSCQSDAQFNASTPCSCLEDSNYDVDLCLEYLPPNELSCEDQNVSDISMDIDLPSSASFEWQSNSCHLSLWPGKQIDSSAELSIGVDFSLSDLSSLTADIEIVETLQEPLPFSGLPGVSIIDAHIMDKGINNIDTNFISIEIDNQLFADVSFELGINEFVDSKEDNTSSLSISANVPSGQSSIATQSLSDMYILNPLGGDVETINISTSIIVGSEYTTIEFDKEYSLGLKAEIKVFELDRINVRLQEFSTPDLPVSSIPAGFVDFKLPTLAFNLIFYNQIRAPLILDLEMIGITGSDSLKLGIKPQLNMPELNAIDTTIITFKADTMQITNQEDQFLLDQNGNSASIFDLFSYDELKIQGRAILEGEGTLERNKALWGDVKIDIQPLSFIFPNDMTIIPQNKTVLEQLDRKTAEQIDSGLVSVELYMGTTNHTPLLMDLSMFISNNDFFPICLDSLNDGSLNNSIVSDTCQTTIKNYFNSNNSEDEINIVLINDTTMTLDSMFVTETKYLINNLFDLILQDLSSEECNGVDTVWWNNQEQCLDLNQINSFGSFYGKMISLKLNQADNIDCNGNVLQPSSIDNTIFMGNSELKWITKPTDLYLSPVITIYGTDNIEPLGVCDSYDSRITINPSDYLEVLSFIKMVFKIEN